MRAKTYINKITGTVAIAVVSLLLSSSELLADGWRLDLSRRSKELTQTDLKEGAPINAPSDKSFFENLFTVSEPVHELIILNTDKGFLPGTLRMREGLIYNVHVVNVNEKEKNVSFVMDSFSEHHATYYGKIKSFQVKPQKEGIFTFVCPETSAQGRVIVYPNNPSRIETRTPASEE